MTSENSRLLPRTRRFVILAALSGSTLLAGCASLTTRTVDADKRPNVVLIVADDLGYSDLGAFGGEIATPNLDGLAMAGVRLTDFHSAPTCSPTRSMLLSGTDNHTAGVGAMAESREIIAGRTTTDQGAQAPAWGYEGVITRRVATLSERLVEGGYFTTMAGKWHLGQKPDEDPHARGFQTSFALLQGANNHFSGSFGPEDNPYTRATFTQNGKVASIPKNFYSSDFYTTKLIEQLDARPRGKPFFAYLAFSAPHSPLQAPPEDIARYKGRYDQGWAALRERRLARMKQLGLVPDKIAPAPVVLDADAWNKLTAEQKKIEARKMEIYAAMVDRLDRNVGRLIARLKATGAYDNTIFIFMSDNGPAAEGAETYGRLHGMAGYLASRDNSFEAMGSEKSAVFYGPYWAQAASAPYRLYKGVATEGGARVPAFLTYPGFTRQGGIGSAFSNVMDVLPTVLDVASVPLTGTVGGRDVAGVTGRSMVPYLQEKTEQVHDEGEAIAFELHGNRSVRQGNWKLLALPKPKGDGNWALYDLANDPAEQVDLSAKLPDRRNAMIAAWNAFAGQTRIPDNPE